MAVIGNSNHPADLVAFHHTSLFSPSISTLEKALDKEYLPPLPGLTKTLLKKYRPDLEATTMGHLDNKRKNIQSTKPAPNDDWTLIGKKGKPQREQAPDTADQDAFPNQDTNKSHHCYLATTEPRNLVFSDQTGRFPIPSSAGNNYLLIAYDYDSNNILLRPIKNRTAECLTEAIQDIHETLTRGGCQPQFHRMDNECPQLTKAFFKQQGVQYQLAPPGDHRTNAAERAIRTAKGHLKAGWWSMDKEFPMHLWDKTIPQAELTLNLLRGSRINPKLSAWEQLHGRYDFNATPIAPPGVRVLAHARTGDRGTWATHAFNAWYVGPALDHYRCFTVWATKTRQTRIVNQVIWFPPKTFPKLTSEELLRATIEDLQVILLNPPTETYVGHMEQTQRGQLIQLHELLNQTVQPVTSKSTDKPNAPAPLEQRRMPPLGVPPAAPRRSDRTTRQPARYTANAANADTDHLLSAPAAARSATTTASNDANEFVLLVTSAPGVPPGTHPPVDGSSHAPTAFAKLLRVPRMPHANDRSATTANTTIESHERASDDNPPALGVPTGTRPPTQADHIQFAIHDLERRIHEQRAKDEGVLATLKTISEALRPSEFLGMAINPDTGKLVEYRHLVTSSMGERWHLAFSKEWGRLFQGYKSTDPQHTINGTDTCQLIHPSEIPEGKKATYIRIVADYREHKADPYRVRCTVGGNLIDFPGDKSTRSADLVTVKCLFNSVVSTPGARAACIDIKDFYLNNPLPNAEFVRFRQEDIPHDIWIQYNLDQWVTKDGFVYARVDKGMYGLPQAGKVASDFLIPRLKEAGYVEAATTPGLFKHKTNSIIFALVVDDFFVQYSSLEDFNHLADTLRKDYEITTDMTASKFCGITLEWNYEEGHVTLSMPGYVAKALHRFTHPEPHRPQHAPHPWVAPNYGVSVQYAAPEDTSRPIDKHETKRLQEVLGTFLFYGRAVDNTMLTALGTLASAQTHGTEQTMDKLVLLMDYATTHPDAKVRFHKSDMILFVHSDASYLSEPKARSRVGGYFYLGLKDEPPDLLKPNGPVHVESRIMKNVMAAASEAEIGALFHNGQETAHMRNVLKAMGHEQTGPTRITTDNSTADGFANKRTKIRRSKAMDMRFYWIQDRVEQGHFRIHWLQGENNHGDYFTKHHSPAHHTKMRPIYLHVGNLAQSHTPDCRGVLIPSPESRTSQSCGGLRAGARASQQCVGSCKRFKLPFQTKAPPLRNS
jgi:hypothetical protein